MPDQLSYQPGIGSGVNRTPPKIEHELLLDVLSFSSVECPELLYKKVHGEVQERDYHYHHWELVVFLPQPCETEGKEHSEIHQRSRGSSGEEAQELL